MVEEKDFNQGQFDEGISSIDSNDIFSDFNDGDDNTSDIFNAIMNSDIPNEEASIEEAGEDTGMNEGMEEGKKEEKPEEELKEPGEEQFPTEGNSSFFSNDILTNTVSAGLDDDPFGGSLFAEAPHTAAGIDSDNPFVELEDKETTTSVDDGNPFAEMNNDSAIDDGNPFSKMEKADKSKDSLASNDGSFFDDSCSPFSSTNLGGNQEDTSIDDFLKSIS